MPTWARFGRFDVFAKALHDAAFAFVYDVETRREPQQHADDGGDDEATSR